MSQGKDGKALVHLQYVEISYDAYHLVSNMNEVVVKIKRKEMTHPRSVEKKTSWYALYLTQDK